MMSRQLNKSAPKLTKARKQDTGKRLDLAGTIKGVPELLSTVLPPLMLFVLVEWLVYHLLFFIPPEWQWQTAGDGRTPSLGTLDVEWDARTLLTLLVSLPLTYVAYFRIRKFHRKWRRSPC